MPYCPKCGVEVNNKKCPLCSYNIKSKLKHDDNLDGITSSFRKIKLSKKDKYKLFATSTYFFSLLVVGLCITIDILITGSISWSVYPAIILLTTSFITTIAIFIPGILKPVLILVFSLIMLLLLDLFIPEVNFFLKVSLPIVCITSLLSFIVVLLSKKSKKRGANVAAYILISIVILTISIEIIVDNFNQLETLLSWSIITAVSLTPIAIFLLYIHYDLSKKIDLKKIFHT